MRGFGLHSVVTVLMLIASWVCVHAYDASILSTLDYHVRFDVTKLDPVQGFNGSFIITVHPTWAPRAAARFYELVENQYYVDNKVFRMVIAYIAEFGFHKEPNVTARWQQSPIKADPRGKMKNQRGYVAFTSSGKNSRSTAIYINYSNNPDMDETGNAPFGEVTYGMATVDSFFPVGTHGKGDGRDTFGPNRQRILDEGNRYLNEVFPKLTHITNVYFVNTVPLEEEVTV